MKPRHLREHDTWVKFIESLEDHIAQRQSELEEARSEFQGWKSRRKIQDNIDDTQVVPWNELKWYDRLTGERVYANDH